MGGRDGGFRDGGRNNSSGCGEVCSGVGGTFFLGNSVSVVNGHFVSISGGDSRYNGRNCGVGSFGGRDGRGGFHCGVDGWRWSTRFTSHFQLWNYYH